MLRAQQVYIAHLVILLKRSLYKHLVYTKVAALDLCSITFKLMKLNMHSPVKYWIQQIHLHCCNALKGATEASTASALAMSI